MNDGPTWALIALLAATLVELAWERLRKFGGIESRLDSLGDRLGAIEVTLARIDERLAAVERTG